MVLHKAIARYGRTASSTEMAILRGNLAQLLIQQKQYTDAEILLQDSLASLNQHTGSEPNQRASLLNSLAFIRHKQGRFAELIDLDREEVRLLEAAFGGEHFYLVAPLNNWANSLVKLDRAEEAAAVYARAMPVCNETTGRDEQPCRVLFDDYATVLRGLVARRKPSRWQRAVARWRETQTGKMAPV